MRKQVSIMALAAMVLMACGGGGDDTFKDPQGSDPPGGENPPPVVVGSLTLTTSTPTIPTDGSTAADIKAFVRDANNNTLAEVPVVFTADAGVLGVTQGTTGTDGMATATLSAPPGDPTNRVITVSATAGTASASVSINATGTRLSVQGAASAVLTQTNTYTVALIDSGGAGVSSQNVTVASTNGNTLSASSLTTDTNGRATFTMTVTTPGNDTLTVSSLGLTATQAVTISPDAFTIVTPAADGQELQLNATQAITVRWQTNGAPVQNQPVQFASTRGALSAPTATTNASGEATVNLQSPTAGAATVTALAGGTLTAQRTVEFVAAVAAVIDVQPGIFTLAPNEQTTITATVRDGAGNLVKNKIVTFNVQDTTGGSLSAASAITDSQGRAQTVYTAGSVASATDGVQITAQVVEGVSTISDTVLLTVARKEVFISLGTGNSITEPNSAQYEIEFVIQVTDSGGNGVANVPLVVSITSENYLKGRRAFVSGAGWTSYSPVFGPCADEDLDHDGVLDVGEDFNSSGRVEAGNIALVTPSAVTTNAQGFAIVKVLYPQEHAYWVNVILEASASVQGTEFKRSSRFLLPGSNADFGSQGTSPPGMNSPFGLNDCDQPN